MGNNNETSKLIKWVIIFCDFLILNAELTFFRYHHVIADKWVEERWHVFLLGCNLAMILAQSQFSTIVHRRMASASDIVKRVFMLSLSQTLIAYMLLHALNVSHPIGRVLAVFGPILLVLILVSRVIERFFVKKGRALGRNTRTVTFVGNDPELLSVYERLVANPTRGYRFLGYYADGELGGLAQGLPLQCLGSLADLMAEIQNKEDVDLGDEVYLSVSRKERSIIRQISHYCDQRVVRFYYVPVSVESLGIDLKREQLEDMEIFTTYELPLANPLNKAVKRLFDIVVSLIALICLLPMLPFIWLIIKIQSPGPLFFKQLRTGLDGKDFYCYKFRSMHVNDDADKVQASKDDPRKFAFGNFMRKANIDELPQFWNVLKGNMSVVGPRPHMLAHTEMYSALIEKYMVRHFVKPGVTGWAQVTGFRGETKELWQMEGRVKRDIWYIEHWSFWLDLRIIWLTAMSVFIHDENAY